MKARGQTLDAIIDAVANRAMSLDAGAQEIAADHALFKALLARISPNLILRKRVAMDFINNKLAMDRSK
jgi:hypothetical protein